MLRRYLSWIMLLSIVGAAWATSPRAAQAAGPTELFFSEYVEGSSNNKALEIYNGTGGSVDLAAGGYNVQMFFNGSASAGLTINLTGSVANGDVYVIAQSSADAAILAEADQTNGSGWFNGDDAVVLSKGTTVIDVIGQIGFRPSTEWGTGLTSTADNTLRRKATIIAGDPTAPTRSTRRLSGTGTPTTRSTGWARTRLRCRPAITRPRSPAQSRPTAPPTSPSAPT